MLKISKNKIYLTRGDTAFIELNLVNQDGETFIPDEGDKVYFRLKQNATSKTLLIEKELSVDTEDDEPHIILAFSESDTNNLKFTTYKYEIEVVTATDNHFTVIENEDFEIGVELEIHDAPSINSDD